MFTGLGKVLTFSKIPFQFTQLMKQSAALIAKPAIIDSIISLKIKCLFAILRALSNIAQSISGRFCGRTSLHVGNS